MLKAYTIIVALLAGFVASAQQIKVEYDKEADMTSYRTFAFGEGQITTPKDQRIVPDSAIHHWIRKAMIEEMTEKGLVNTDSGADLVISYLTGSEKRSDMGSVGPLGMTPGSNTQNYMRDYQQGSLVIDLNSRRSNKLVWRVSAITDSNQQEGDPMVDEIVEKGFKKFSIKPKKEKKKK